MEKQYSQLGIESVAVDRIKAEDARRQRNLRIASGEDDPQLAEEALATIGIVEQLMQHTVEPLGEVDKSRLTAPPVIKHVSSSLLGLLIEIPVANARFNP